MKVSELIAMLSKLDGESEVVFPDGLPLTEATENEGFVTLSDSDEDDEYPELTDVEAYLVDSHRWS